DNRRVVCPSYVVGQIAHIVDILVRSQFWRASGSHCRTYRVEGDPDIRFRGTNLWEENSMKLLLLAATIVGGLLAGTPAMAQSARLGYVPTEDHPVGQASRHFAKLVEEKTGGRIKIETFGNGVLGSEPDMQASVQAGFIDIMVGPTPNLVGVVPEFMIYDLPFFYKDFAAVDAVMDGEVGERLFSLLQEKTGIVGLAWWDNGFRHMTNAVRAVNTVEDMAGLNIRVIPNPLFIATWKALGTNPTPLPWPELYAALENRAVDGQETPYALIYTARFY